MLGTKKVAGEKNQENRNAFKFRKPLACAITVLAAATVLLIGNCDKITSSRSADNWKTGKITEIRSTSIPIDMKTDKPLLPRVDKDSNTPAK